VCQAVPQPGEVQQAYLALYRFTTAMTFEIFFLCQDVPQPARSPAGNLALYQDRRMRGMYVYISVGFRVEGLGRLLCSLSRPADAWYVCVCVWCMCVCVMYHTHTHTYRKPVHIAHSRAAGQRTQAQILKSPFFSKVLFSQKSFFLKSALLV
jgi:hypothetical protein